MRTTILAPCGMLGYGFPQASFDRALAKQPDAIIVDAGSTDAGPHKLGAGVAIVSRMAAKKDLTCLMRGAKARGIPLLIGSAGGSGARVHTQWTLSIIEEIAKDMDTAFRVAVIWADIAPEAILAANEAGKIRKMNANVPDLTAETLAKTNGIVAQMGVEPILEALKQKPDIVLCGRAYDPAPFAAFAISRGHDAALAEHMGKILECGALCAEPGTTKDCMLGMIDDSGFEVWPVDPARKCTTVSVAAHSFYEKTHPTLLLGPGTQLDLTESRFIAMEGGRVRVEGSRVHEMTPYTIKLEGAMPCGYRTFVLAGIRDPLLISQLDAVEAKVREGVFAYYQDECMDGVQLNFVHYGIDGVMGPLEPTPVPGHEVGLLIEVIAPTQALADAVCATARSTYLHYGYPGRKATAGNLAFPFAPSDVSFGAVYTFSVYHVMEVSDPVLHFPIEMLEVGK